MIDDNLDGPPSRLVIGSPADWHAVASRRSFLRLVGLGGALVLLPGFVSACDSDGTTAPTDDFAGSGEPLIIDFAQGDVAILSTRSCSSRSRRTSTRASCRRSPRRTSLHPSRPP